MPYSNTLVGGTTAPLDLLCCSLNTLHLLVMNMNLKRKKPNNSTIGSDSDDDESIETAISTKSAPCKYTLKGLPKSVSKTEEAIARSLHSSKEL